MSVQIAVRLDEDLVARVDELVRSGAVRSRAQIVESALERELRRRLYERDVEIYATTDPGEDLRSLESWLANRDDYPDLDEA